MSLDQFKADFEKRQLDAIKRCQEVLIAKLRASRPEQVECETAKAAAEMLKATIEALVMVRNLKD